MENIDNLSLEEIEHLQKCLSLNDISIIKRVHSDVVKNRKNAILRWRIKKIFRKNKIRKNMKKSRNSYQRLRYKGRFIREPKNNYVSVTELEKIDYY